MAGASKIVRELERSIDHASGSIPYTLRYMSQRKKSIGLKVSRSGAVTVLAPKHCSEAEVQLFVSYRSDWIYQQLSQFKMEQDEQQTAPSYLLFGEELKLAFTQNHKNGFLGEQTLYLP